METVVKNVHVFIHWILFTAVKKQERKGGRASHKVWVTKEARLQTHRRQAREGRGVPQHASSISDIALQLDYPQIPLSSAFFELPSKRLQHFLGLFRKDELSR